MHRAPVGAKELRVRPSIAPMGLAPFLLTPHPGLTPPGLDSFARCAGLFSMSCVVITLTQLLMQEASGMKKTIIRTCALACVCLAVSLAVAIRTSAQYQTS